MSHGDDTSVRLYVDAVPAIGQALTLTPAQNNYVRHVLRFRDGDTLLVFDGRNGEWRARFCLRGKRDSELDILQYVRPQPPAGDLWYLFAPLKHARLDYMVQKATEMGANCLQPVVTAHTQTSRVNLERMASNVIEACEQCGVLNVPEVRGVTTLEELLAHWPLSRRLLVGDEGAALANPHHQLSLLPPSPLALLIGPEGGFSAGERSKLRAHPAVTPLSLGPRILRADTAAVAALAIVQSALGDWQDTQM